VGLALLMSGLSGRASLWRPLAMLGAGGSVAVLCFLYMAWVAQPKPAPLALDPAKPVEEFFKGIDQMVPKEMADGIPAGFGRIMSIPGRMAKEMRHPGTLKGGPYLALAAAIGLLVLGGLQVRAWVRQRRGLPVAFTQPSMNPFATDSGSG